MNVYFYTACIVFFPIAAIQANAGQPVSCIYAEKQGELEDHSECGEYSKEGHFTLYSPTLKKIAFGEDGLACVLINTASGLEAVYVNSSGKTQPVLFFDNGCDYFEGGLARTQRNNKVAYINRRLEVEVLTDFEQGLPFDYEHAVVCNGPFTEEVVGEHSIQHGGRCGLIDRSGTLVVPARYPIDERDVFQLYIDSHNECEAPPISTEAAALCHAKRHARMLDNHSDNWTWYEIKRDGENWQIDFIQVDDPTYRLTMEINGQTAHWISIIPTTIEQ